MKISDDNRHHIWSSIIWPAFINNIEDKGLKTLESLDAAFPYIKIIEKFNEKYLKQRLHGLTCEQIDNLKEKGWQIGWHTFSHFPVGKLPIKTKKEELEPNPVCNSFVMSFPYGGETDIDEKCLEIIKQNGFTTALSNVNTCNKYSGRWFRARMSLSSDVALLHFELSGLKHLLKHRRLLPKI